MCSVCVCDARFTRLHAHYNKFALKCIVYAQRNVHIAVARRGPVGLVFWARTPAVRRERERDAMPPWRFEVDYRGRGIFVYMVV